MRICVENGTFTVAFLKEGLMKVKVTILLVLHLFLHLRSSVDGWMISSKPRGKRVSRRIS